MPCFDIRWSNIYFSRASDNWDGSPSPLTEAPKPPFAAQAVIGGAHRLPLSWVDACPSPAGAPMAR
jgi:hypothetical protein